METTQRFKKLRQEGVYESTSRPKKVDDDRVRQIIDRQEQPRRKRREDRVHAAQPVTVPAG